jgi:hypothetical protein
VRLLDAGTTGATLGAGIADALEKRHAATRISAAIAAVSNLDTAALYQHREKVALAAYDLSDPKAEVDVSGKGDGDVARRQGS